METETTVTSTSNVVNSEINAEGFSSSADKQKSAINWADDADMNLNNNIFAFGEDFENTLLTLNPPAAEDADKHQSNSSIEKGKNVDNSPNKQDFIQIPRLTRIFTTAPAEKINGDKPEMMIINMQKLFAVTPGFLGAKHFSNKKSIAIYFDKEYNLKKAIEFDNKTNKLSVSCFTVANSQQDRFRTTDRSIKVTNIPLDIKSEVIRAYFDQFGTITRFSIDSQNIWQIAFITFEEKSSINHYYYQWSTNIMDYSVKVFPIDFTKEQLEF